MLTEGVQQLDQDAVNFFNHYNAVGGAVFMGRDVSSPRPNEA